jgi:hypothetical protein
MEPGVKIEIGESLIYSWLRDVQECIVTQMNWKPSPTWDVAQERELTEAFEAVRNFASQDIGVQIFKKGEFRQFIRQAEIDVLGLFWNHDTASPSVFAVDSAFHENGLQYGNADETVGRVLKKLIRSAFAIEAYLDVAEANVIFAAPKMAETVQERIQHHLGLLEKRLAEQRSSAMPKVHFRIIANADFADEILAPVLEQVDAVADTSELFMRAQQLMRLCHSSPRSGLSGAKIDHSPQQQAEEGDRIGEHVRATMRQLAAAGRLTARIVGDLLDARYCKATFNLGLPLLKSVDQTASLQSQRIDRKGYGRYWKQPLRIGDHEFLMCCQWFVWQRGAFDAWVRDIGETPRQPDGIAHVGPQSSLRPEGAPQGDVTTVPL